MLVLAPASHDFRDGEQEWQCDDSYHAGPRECEPGDDESGHAEALPYRVMPQKPHQHDGFLHLWLLPSEPGIGRSGAGLYPSDA